MCNLEEKLGRKCLTENNQRAGELLMDLIDRTRETSGTHKSVTVCDHSTNVQELGWRFIENLKSVVNDPQFAFLEMAMIEDTWNFAKPLIFVPIEDVLSGKDQMIKSAVEIERIIADDPYRAIWKEKADGYAKMVRGLGFDANPEDFSDLTTLSAPFADAFTFWDRAEPYEMRSGDPAGDGPVTFIPEVSRFGSAYEFGEAVMKSAYPRAVAFGAIVTLCKTNKDRLTEYLTGRPDERERNYCRYEHMTPEQYDESVSRQSIMCAIRNGGRLWMVTMPRQNNYNDAALHLKSSDRYYYGKRASYAPYEIFFEDRPVPESDSTYLTVVKRSVLISELYDKEQMAWLPVFLESTRNRFFKEVPEKTRGLFREELASVAGDRRNCTDVTAVTSRIYEIQDPEKYLTSENDRYLIKRFGLTKKDIEDAPIAPVHNAIFSENLFEELCWTNTKEAYLYALAKKIAEFVEENVWDVRRKVLDLTDQMDLRALASRAVTGKLSFADVIVDKVNGETSMHDMSSASAGIQILKECMYQYCRWVDDSVSQSRKPPVLIRILPDNAGQYAELYGWSEDEIPELIKELGHLDEFRKEHESKIRRYDYAYRYDSTRYRVGNSAEPSFIVPRLMQIRLGLGKKLYNEMLKKG